MGRLRSAATTGSNSAGTCGGKVCSAPLMAMVAERSGRRIVLVDSVEIQGQGERAERDGGCFRAAG